MKKTGFNGYVYDLSVGFDAIAVNYFLDIHKYLMKKKKHNVILIKMSRFIKQVFYAGLTVLSYLNPLSTNQLSCISMNNQEC